MFSPTASTTAGIVVIFKRRVATSYRKSCSIIVHTTSGMMPTGAEAAIRVSVGGRGRETQQTVIQSKPGGAAKYGRKTGLEASYA